MGHEAEAAQLSPLKQAYLALEKLQVKLDSVEKDKRQPIAIVGVGCRFPGGIRDLESCWDLLREGVDAVTEIPPDRWDVARYYDADPDAPGKISTRYGAFLDDIDRFDAKFFNIAPREANSMDPQQRLLLEVAWEALENAGLAADVLAGSPTGIFVGLTGSDYAHLFTKTGDQSLLDAYYASGIAHSIASGRLSYILGLQGPSLTIDTACSSSLVAIHLAIQSLRSGECRTALAGGVNLILDPDIFIALSKYGMLAPDGRCKSFDASANGFVRGEGCGVIVLKRLSDAVADGDNILAVIRGSAVNQDGASTGLTAPNGQAQEAVISEALANSGLKPDQVVYLEAHGTGTPLGDPIEVQAAARALRGGPLASKNLPIGSIKTNFGHLEAAAGIAGLIKCILILQNREIPPHLHLTELNPFVNWEQLPLAVPTQRTSLDRESDTPVVGVSSFGFSGTNAHILLEAAPVQEPVDAVAERPLQLLTLSARSEAALQDLAARYSQHMAAHPQHILSDVAYSANTGRTHFEQRLALRADTLESAQAELEAFARGEASSITAAAVQNSDRPKIAFLFTGQGSQYAGMGRDLYETQPTFRAALDQCARILDDYLDQPLIAVLFDDETAAAYLDDTTYTQPAMFALEYALAQLWLSWGIQPAAVMGHSVGEYVAACIAGVFSLEAGLKLIALRGKLMGALPTNGTMAAVFADEALVREAVDPYARTVSIAANNGEGNIVISGLETDVQAVLDKLKSEGLKSRRLTVSHAFHSPLMDSILDEFEQAVAQLELNAARMRLISNLTGKVAGAEITQPDYWRRHLRETVQFAASMRLLQQQGYELYIEIGPGTTLLGMGQRSLGDEAQGSLWLPSLRSGKDEWAQMLDSLGNLYLYGVTPDWQGFDRDYPRRKLVLPSYPFQRARHWMPAPKTRLAAGLDLIHPLLGYRLRSPLKVLQFENQIERQSFSFLNDHQVRGARILPATGYIELAMAAAQAVFGGSDHRLHDLLIRDPLVAGDDVRTAQLIVTPEDNDRHSFEYLSIGEGETEWTVHASGMLLAWQGSVPEHESLDSIRERCIEVISAAEHYAFLHHLGFNFGDSLHGVAGIWQGKGEVLGEVSLPDGLTSEARKYHMHPALLDACLQIIAWALPDRDSAYLPFSIEGFTLYRPPQASLWSHAQIRPESNAKSGSFTADLLVLDEQGVVAEIEGIYFRRSTASALKPAFADWLYEIKWQPKPLNGARPYFSLSPAALVEPLTPQLSQLAAEHRLENFSDGLLPELEALSVSYILQAFDELGWDAQVGDQFTGAELQAQLQIAPQHQRLFGRLLEMLAEEAILEETRSGWRVRAQGEPGSPQLHLEALRQAYPEHDAELTLTAWCGDQLAEVLAGRMDGVSLLFQDGGAVAERMYVNAPTAKVYNGLMLEALHKFLADRPAGRRLRVLEIGAGTGGTSAYLLPALPAEATSYTFTDISPVLVAKASEKSSSTFPFVQFQVLNVEEDPAGQDLAGQEFDLIIAANVIHATADLNQTLAHVRQLLAPQGILLMTEVTRRQRWLDITFGLTDGWWRFTDNAIRADYPLLGQAGWSQLLAHNGFSDVVTIPEVGTRFDLQAVIVARGPDKVKSAALPDPGDWLILADRDGIGEALADALRQRGEHITLVNAAEIDLADPQAFVPLITDHLGQIVHLWSLDLQLPADAVVASLLPEQRQNSGSLLHLVQAMGNVVVAPQLWIVTQGAQPISGDSLPDQATAWGMGKVIALEHPEFQPVCIDLDPDADNEAAARWLLAEILAADGETQAAYRAGTRHVARLTRKTVAPVVAQPDVFYVEKSPDGVLDDIVLLPSERRAPGPGEIEIQVFAAGLNFRDVMNALAMRDDPEPLGGECSGRVTALGAGVTDFEVGDEVVALAHRCFSSYVTDRADLVLPKPRNMSYEQAAAFPLVFLTAHYALNQLGRLAPGERVLIHAGAGGVGLAALQLAQRVGAEIFATAGTPEKRALLTSMGVQHVMDSRSLDFVDEISYLTKGEGVNVVLNSLAGDFIEASLSVLAANGRFLEIGKRDIWTAEEVAEIRPEASYFIIDLATFIHEDRAFIRSMFTELLDAARAGELQGTPLTTFPMQAAAEAFRFMAQARHTGKIVLTLDENRYAGRLTIRPDASYLITGGLSGLGLLTARFLVDEGARHLLLLGRSAPSPEAQASIAAMEALGAEITFAQADVSQLDQMAALLADLDPAWPLRGIIHSAGALEDGALLRQEWSRFVTPMAAKVDGAWNLHALTLPHRLDFFVLYSSVASVFGSTGQANHAAANAFMDSLAFYRRARGLPALSINWGAWAEIGAAVERQVGERISAQGIDMIPPDQGLAVLKYLMLGDAAQVAVTPVNWTQFLSQYERDSLPDWLSLMASEAQATVSEPARTMLQAREESADLLQALENAPPNKHYEILSLYISDQAARVLGLESGQSLADDIPLNEMGLDSLMAVELRNRLTASLDLKRSLPATLVFDYPTVEALASYIWQDVLGLGGQVEAAEPKEEPVDALSSIEDLSEEEVDRLLKNMGLQ